MSTIHVIAHDLELEWSVNHPDLKAFQRNFYPYMIRDFPRYQVVDWGPSLWQAIFNWLYNHVVDDERWR